MHSVGKVVTRIGGNFLFQIVRQDVYTDVNVVPTLSVSGSRRLNAYALDFFKHGSSKVIERDNGLVLLE